jgi:hypothetical protein
MKGVRLHDYGPDYSTMNPNFPALRRIMAGLFASAFLCFGIVIFLATRHPVQVPVHRRAHVCNCKAECLRQRQARP